MIIGCELMAHLGLVANFKRQVLQWDGATVPMKNPINLICQTYLRSCDIFEVVIQTAEIFYTREATKGMVKIIHITYANSDLKHIYSNETHLDYYEKTKLLGILK